MEYSLVTLTTDTKCTVVPVQYYYVIMADMAPRRTETPLETCLRDYLPIDQCTSELRVAVLRTPLEVGKKIYAIHDAAQASQRGQRGPSSLYSEKLAAIAPVPTTTLGASDNQKRKGIARKQ
jgi:hypothetical protein